MSDYDYVTVTVVRTIRESDSGLAIFVKTDDWEEVSLPISQLKDGYYPSVGRSGRIQLPRWLAEREELEYAEP